MITLICFINLPDLTIAVWTAIVQQPYIIVVAHSVNHTILSYTMNRNGSSKKECLEIYHDTLNQRVKTMFMMSPSVDFRVIAYKHEHTRLPWRVFSLQNVVKLYIWRHNNVIGIIDPNSVISCLPEHFVW